MSLKKLFLLLTLTISSALYAQSPLHVYLYWDNENLSDTMTIGFHSPIETSNVHAYISNTKNVSIQNAKKTPPTETKCYQELKRCVHRFSLRGLKPASPYYFILNDGKNNLTEEKKFRTLGKNPNLITMVSGGDLSVTRETKILLTKSAGFSPDLAVLGGDLAYDDGELRNIGLWDLWLNLWEEAMVTPDGFIIPMILAIGNHEVKGGWKAKNSDATLFLKFFQQDEKKTYFSRELGKLAVLMILDSGHIASVEEQVPWILKNLTKYKDVPYRFAAYHVPLYPSNRHFENEQSSLLRKFWGPVFDRGLTFALEHHDHSLKRTHRIRAGKRDAKNGVLYLGDGCFGIAPRPVHPESWYLAKATSVAHFWVTKFKKESVKMEAIGQDGQVFDSSELRNSKTVSLK